MTTLWAWVRGSGGTFATALENRAAEEGGWVRGDEKAAAMSSEIFEMLARTIGLVFWAQLYADSAREGLV